MVIRAITGGIRPEKPEGAKRLGFSNELWRIIQLCWREDRSARPCVDDILFCLKISAVPGIEKQRGKLLPRITSFFRLPQEPELEIERLVNEMDKVDLPPFPHPQLT